MTARTFAIEVVKTLRSAGHEALFAGGCVRDQLWGREPDDYDVATSALPNEVQQLFRKTIAVGVSFGVIEVLGPKPHKVQVATFRSDGPYSDGRHPDRVMFTSAEEDARRRDFTINGLFFDPIDDRLIDYVGGEADLRHKVLRAIGNPRLRFQEDRLRMLRAVRFAARFELALEADTAAAIAAMAPEVTQVSGERIAEELRKLLQHPHRARGAELLETTGLRAAILPTVAPIDPARHLQLDLLGAEPSFSAGMAVLLGAIGPAEIHRIAAQLRLSNHERDRIQWLIQHREALVHPEQLPGHRLKPLLAHPGIRELFDVHRALGHSGAVAWCEMKLLEWPREVIDPPPLVTGEDLIAHQLTPGPEFRRLLDVVRRQQLDGELTNRADALEYVRQQIGR
jgi:poly(A) polymerase